MIYIINFRKQFEIDHQDFIQESEGEEIYDHHEQDDVHYQQENDDEGEGMDEYENLLINMRQKVKQMKNKLKADHSQKQISQFDNSQYSNNFSNKEGQQRYIKPPSLEISGQNHYMNQISNSENAMPQQHYMSGFISSPSSEFSKFTKNANCMQIKSPSENKVLELQNVQYTGDETESCDSDILNKLEILSKENKSLKEANRRHMPYNMQIELLKAEESEEFYRQNMYEKEKQIDGLKRQCKMFQKRCEQAYDIQHDMENALEEYEVNTK